MSAVIFIRRGATLNLPLDFFTDDTETTPVNLTGSTFTIVNSTFPVEPTFTVLTPATGNTKLTLSATNTANLVKGRNYLLTLRQVQGNGDIVLHGPLTFNADDQ